LPAILPFAISFIIYGGSLFTTLGVLALFLLAVNLAFSGTVYRTVRESLLLRFENAQLLEDLRVEQQRAVAADQAKSLFLASASHDLRQPAHAMSLFVSALAELSNRPSLDPAMLQKIVAQLRQALGGMNLLLSKLLDVSRLDTGLVKANPQSFPLNSLFDGLRAEFETGFQEKALDFRIVPSSVWVSSDPVLLHQIASNLLSNALRYTRTGRVLLGCRRRGAEVEIQVLDTGIGIAEEELAHIFDEFYQVANVTRNREQGLGLGLAIVRRAAALLGARLGVATVLGKGSKFSITVPRTASATTIEPQGAPAAPAWPRRTILVIDDDEEVLSAMTLLLDIMGHEVIPAGTFAAALEAAATYQAAIDLVLSDYRLGEGVSGIDAIRGVTAILGRDVQAALITGDTSPDRLREAGASGLTVLHKPLDADALMKLFDTDTPDSKFRITDPIEI
jgi:signal transduction histidine kinase/CheY-like chemotaxis protein